MTIQKTHPRDNRPALSVSEYLWLEAEKNRISYFEKEIIKMQYRQDRQSSWIALLVLAVIVLGMAIALLILL